MKKLVQNIENSILQTLRYHTLDKKLMTPSAIFVLLMGVLSITYLTVLVNALAGIGLVAAIIAITVCVSCLVSPTFGFYFPFIVSLFLLLPGRLSNSALAIPTGMIPEYLSYLALIGVATHHSYRLENKNKFWTHAITIMMLIQIFYYAFQLLNPNMFSKLGWFNFFRKQISFLAFFYLAYLFLNTKSAIQKFNKFWIGYSTLNALYACKQQWFGFFDFEYIWLISDEKRYNLYVNGGFVRRFGLLSDPASAGILYAMGTCFLLVLMLRSKIRSQQILYGILMIIHFLATSFTGTRTATLMIVAGAVFYCVLTLYEKRTLIFSGIFGFLLLFLLFAPIYNNMVINRLRSTFEGSKDPSAKVRDINRAIVQPYIYSHPIGGGVNTSGIVGQMYNPGHFLSMIPPDSAYMQTMMEQGYIGLLLMLVFYYIVLRTGIKHFYRVRDDDLKTIYTAYLVTIFTLYVAQYSQLAIGQYPGIFFYLVSMVVFMRMHEFDSSKTPDSNHS